MRTLPPWRKTPETAPTVLSVRDEAEYWRHLKVALQAESLPVQEVRWFSEAARHLTGAEPPQMVFTAVLLADGDWEKVLLLGKRIGVPVVVVSTCLDVRFCLDVLERGAFDFLVPPFEQEDVSYIVRAAGCRGAPFSTPLAA